MPYGQRLESPETGLYDTIRLVLMWSVQHRWGDVCQAFASARELLSHERGVGWGKEIRDMHGERLFVFGQAWLAGQCFRGC